jgi:hypothetical protein
MIPTAFDRWLAAILDRDGPFTMFLILMAEEPTTIVPIRSSYVHVIGPDIRWDELVAMIGEADADWHSVAVFAAKAQAGGPMPDVEARQRLASLQAAVIRDRLTVRKGELFDRLGRKLELSPLPH